MVVGEIMGPVGNAGRELIAAASRTAGESALNGGVLRIAVDATLLPLDPSRTIGRPVVIEKDGLLTLRCRREVYGGTDQTNTVELDGAHDLLQRDAGSAES